MNGVTLNILDHLMDEYREDRIQFHEALVTVWCPFFCAWQGTSMAETMRI
jgi:hypothetical protein